MRRFKGKASGRSQISYEACSVKILEERASSLPSSVKGLRRNRNSGIGKFHLGNVSDNASNGVSNRF